jgi:hypothetical protein
VVLRGEFKDSCSFLPEWRGISVCARVLGEGLVLATMHIRSKSFHHWRDSQSALESTISNRCLVAYT